MNQIHAPGKRPVDVTSARSTVLGEMHRGQMEIEEKHPFLRKLVRNSIAGNLSSLLLVFAIFRFKDLIPPHNQPFMTAIGWYFFFGAVYGVFAQCLFSYGRYTERAAVTRSLTQNRRYEWHTHYDTANIRDEDLKKVAAAPVAPAADGPALRARQGRQAVVAGVGRKSFFYAAVFALLGLCSAVAGMYTFFHTLF